MIETVENGCRKHPTAAKNDWIMYATGRLPKSETHACC